MLLIIVSMLIGALAIKCTKYLDGNKHEGLATMFSVIAIVAILVTFMTTGIAIAKNICAESDTAKMKQMYDDLRTQAELGFYENDNDLGKKQLADDILKWNTELVHYQSMHRNQWVSVMYPIDADWFDTIPMKFLQTRVG